MICRNHTIAGLLLLAISVQGWPQTELKNYAPSLPYYVVDTGQRNVFNDRGQLLKAPKVGEAFYGQDAQVQSHPASYTLGRDGLTVLDNNTGLTWQRSPDTNGDGALTRDDKLTLAQAQARPAKLNTARFGGFEDWRLPSIKELYSLFDARGTDPSGYQGSDTSGLTPFIDTKFFKFAYGSLSTGERIIDSQYASSTRYVGKSARGFDKLFGVNFADGRIKGYDLQMPGGGEKTFFVQCVRGNPDYGKNDFRDNGDGTITDRATGLVWARDDSKKAMNWRDALAWVNNQNAEKFLGRDDWRLPSVKELQSIVDYTRSPDTTHSPALSPLFGCSTITNEGGQADYPCYWSATTHVGFMGGGAAMYVAFGRAAGWLPARMLAGGAPGRRGGFGGGGPGQGGPRGEGMQGESAGDYRFVDVHGAGAQRSDPKAGDPTMFPHGRGPQGDVIRIYNYVRLVRNAEPKSVRLVEPDLTPLPTRQQRPMGDPMAADGPPPEGPPDGPGMGSSRLPVTPMITALDLNGDGVIDAAEMAKAPGSLKKLDKNGDGKLTPDEFLPQRPGGPGFGGAPQGSPGGFEGGPRPGGRGGPGGNGPSRMLPPVVTALDANGDGAIDAGEIAQAAAALKKLDKNGDGKLTPDEYRPQFGGARGGR